MNKNMIKPMAFLPPFIIMTIFVMSGVLFTKKLGTFLDSVLMLISENFGWLFMVVGVVCIISCAYLAFSKIGTIRFGGDDAKPDLSIWQWFSISLCSGIGTGILFWGMGEPLFYFAQPSQASGLQPFTRAAAINAVSQTQFHWTIIQYSIYTVGAVGIAFAAYNRKEGFNIMSGLSSILGKRSSGILSDFIHAFCIFGLVGAISSSMGAALLQVGSGINFITGITENSLLWLIIAIFITAVFTISSISGMKKGLSFLSDLNTKIFFGILIFIIIVGPTVFIFDMIVTSFGDSITTFANRATVTSVMTTDKWTTSWTTQFIASYVVVFPFVALFYARLAKGRTVRQFIAMTIFGPSFFCFIWIAVFGSVAINLQNTGADIWASVQSLGMQSTVFNIFKGFPFATLFIAIFLFTICTSLITYADPVTSILSVLSSKSTSIDSEPPAYLKLIWGIFIGTISYILISTGGIDGIRAMFTIVGFPIIFILIPFCVATIKSGHSLLKKK